MLRAQLRAASPVFKAQVHALVPSSLSPTDSSPPPRLFGPRAGQSLFSVGWSFWGDFLPHVAVNWPLFIKAWCPGQILCLRPLYVLFYASRLITSGSKLRLLRKRRPGYELWVMPSTEQRTESLMRYIFACKHHPAAVSWHHMSLTASKDKCFFLVKHLITVYLISVFSTVLFPFIHLVTSWVIETPFKIQDSVYCHVSNVQSSLMLAKPNMMNAIGSKNVVECEVWAHRLSAGGPGLAFTYQCR